MQNEYALMNIDEYTTHCKKQGIQFKHPLSSSAMLETAKLPKHEDIPDPIPAIEGLIDCGDIITIAGTSKCFKSFFATNMALKFKNGGDFFGRKVYKLKTTLFDTEMKEKDYKKRGFAEHHGDGLEIFLFKKIMMSMEIENLKRIERLRKLMHMIEEHVKQENIKVIIIDCVYKLIDDRNRDEVHELLKLLRNLNKKNVLTILVHHYTKNANNTNSPLENIAGSSDFTREIDGGILLSKNGSIDNKPVVSIKFVIRSAIHLDDVETVFVQNKHIIINEAVKNGLISTQEISNTDNDKICVLKKFIREHVPEEEKAALPTNKLIELMKNKWSDNQWKLETIKRYKLAEWIDAGYLKVTGQKPKRYYQGDQF